MGQPPAGPGAFGTTIPTSSGGAEEGGIRLTSVCAASAGLLRAAVCAGGIGAGAPVRAARHVAHASSLVTRVVVEAARLDHLISLLLPPERKEIEVIFPALQLIRLERLNFH